MLAEPDAVPSMTTMRRGGSADELEAGAAWGCCPEPRRLGELLTRGDICHVHADRAGAERCGVLLGDAPELVRLRGRG